MSKSSFAKEEVMEEYFSSLLTDSSAPLPAESLEQQRLEKLFHQIRPIEDSVVESEVQTTVETKETAREAEKSIEPVVEPEPGYRQGTFQALYFRLAGLTLAVPLTELGGIHQLAKLNPLFGKPDWFLGVMIHREEKLNIVDSARWVMPEKVTEHLADSLNYQYVIMLGNSEWGLACESLVDTITLEHDDVKWRERAGKRPWLAGMVKEKMCALVDVAQLIDMLNQGHNSQAD